MSENLLETQAAAALRHIARNEAIKGYVQQNAPLYQALLRMALRFIGGELLPQCQETALTLNKQGSAVAIDYMGESTRDAAMAQQATQEFLNVIAVIATQNLNASIALDLSHIGLTVDADLAFRNATTLAQAAQSAGIEMMISMEGSERISEILGMHQRLCEHFENIGITFQAYLFRTAEDLVSALGRPGRIRLVKGAYEEPANVAMPRDVALDHTYLDFMEKLLTSGHSCSIATHDLALLEHAHTFIQEHQLSYEPFEFEMLYGVTPDRLQMMRDRGYSTRIYLAYGKEWYLYLCHRLAEYPPNIYQAIADAVIT